MRREAAFVKDNSQKWKAIEENRSGSPDELAQQFIELTDDLSYAKTFYPDSKTSAYLNSLASKVHQHIYKNKKEKKNRFANFWKYELPYLFKASHKQLLYSFLIFIIAGFIGAVSAANDDDFIRLILGDSYVNMTIENIKKGDPMAVYKSHGESEMFLMITTNNIRVAFMAFVMGIFFSVGTGYMLFQNGVMLGAFQYFFFQNKLLLTSMLTIWIHGTLEISSIIIAGCAGFVMGNSILFPKTYSRLESFKRGAKQGLKIVISLVPIFMTAGFLESFVTRHTEMPMGASIAIIATSLTFILWYFIFYPIKLHRKTNAQFTIHDAQLVKVTPSQRQEA